MKNISLVLKTLMVSLAMLAFIPAFAGTSNSFADLQGQTVKVTVTDNVGAVPGASVLVKGTTNGTTTDGAGVAVINNVPSNATIVVSFLGYITQEIPVGGRVNIDVLLKEDAELLSETVVVGYGTQKKVNLSGSVSTVNVSDLAESRPMTNISQVLAGAAAGVQVTQSSNAPGNDNASILVRGTGTLNTSSPLVIVDGMESSISSVNPQDIEAISILKDAASSAIYGSRAANCVNLSTTKSGKGEKIKVDYNGYVSIESLNTNNSLTPVSNFADYMEYMNLGYANNGTAPIFSQEKINEWRSNPTSPTHPNTDWIKETFHPAVLQNHNISFSGSTDKIRMYASMGFLKNPVIMENSGQDKYNGRINLEADVKPWMTLGVNASGFHAETALGTDRISSAFTYMCATTPGMTFYSDGHYGAIENPEDYAQAATNNPLRTMWLTDGYRWVNSLKTRFTASIRPFKGMSINASYNWILQDTESKSKPHFIDLWSFTNDAMFSSGVGQTSITQSDSKFNRAYGDVTANYANRFGKFDLSVLAGASQEQYRSWNFSASRRDLIDTELFALSAATGDPSVSGTSSEWAMHSGFGRINLGWDDKYLFEANLRGDSSSRFAPGKRWGWFPSASEAWRITQEPFMAASKGWLNELKLRVSYGGLGNNSVGNYESISLLAAQNYVLNNNTAVGMATTAIANSALTWETTYVANLGFDFAMFRNRLTGSIEAFNKRTVDILINLPAPAVHGTASIPTQNAAIVRNNGIELTLGYNNQIGDFSYNINGNFSYIENKVIKFKGDDYTLSGNKMIKEGLPINVWYMYEYDRIIQTEEDMAIVKDMIAANKDAFTSLYGATGPQYGDLLYKDQPTIDTDGDDVPDTCDGIINAEDRIIVNKHSKPRFLFGLNLSAAYKGFDASVMFQGMAGYRTFFQSAQLNTPTVRYGYQINKAVAEGAWTEGRTDATYPRLLEYSNTRNTEASTFYLYNNSFLKIRNIQIGYSLPSKLMDKISISKIRIYTSFENFFTFTQFKGFDPELGASLTYPTMRQATLGLNITF